MRLPSPVRSSSARARVGAATLAVALVMTVAACGSDSGSGNSSSATPSASASSTAAATASAADVAALKSVTVAGDLGAAATLTFDKPFTVSAPVARVVDKGTGAPLVDGQLMTIEYVTVSGADGSSLYDSWTVDSPETMTVGATGIDSFDEVLAGQKVGVRVLLAFPDTDSTTLIALEVVSAKDIPTRAEGEAVAPVDGLPTVKLADDGAPSITTVAGDPPTSLVAQPLIKGSGKVVASGDNLIVKYSGWLWNGTSFDSSWDAGSTFPVTIGTGQVISGWDTGLVGQTVGSQVLLVVPPAEGYGNTDNGSIPAGSTLIFVVDILDAS